MTLPVTHSPVHAALSQLAGAAVQSMPSPNTRRVYGKRIAGYLSYVCRGVGSPAPIDRDSVQGYLLQLREAGMGMAGLNQVLSAVKLLAVECEARTLISRTTLDGITGIKGVKQRGVRTGNWLTREQLQRLLELPDSGSEVGRRDAALLAVMAGCGLRRAEVAGLTWDRLQERWGRWVLSDIVGKGGRVRTVGVPGWVVELLSKHKGAGNGQGEQPETEQMGDEGYDGKRSTDSQNVWGQDRSNQNGSNENMDVCEGRGTSTVLAHLGPGQTSGTGGPDGDHLLRTQDRIGLVSGVVGGGQEQICEATRPDLPRMSGRTGRMFSRSTTNRLNTHLSTDHITPSGVHYIISTYASRLQIGFAPHDLRRTYAALARDGGAPLEQIQAELGHSDISTTRIYLGTIEGLKPGKSAGDFIQLIIG